MKKLLLLVAAICFSSIGYLQAQCAGQVNSLIISTGYNPAGSNLVADFALDPMWRLTQAPPDPVGWTSNIGGPAIVIPISSAWNFAGSNSKYINAYPTNAALTDNWVTTSTPYIFERSFCVCLPDEQGPQSADVTFNLALNADNWAELILEDDQGNPTILVSQPYVYSTANFDSNPTTANVTLNLSVGTYTLKLYHRNRLVDMGVNLDGVMTSTALVSDPICSETGSLAGFIYEDLNGNNLKDANDLLMAEREVRLYDGEDIFIQSTTTDHAGYYFFMDLVPGQYRIEAVDDLDWDYASSTGSNIITLETNKVTLVNFQTTNYPTGIDTKQAVTLFEVYPNPNAGAFTVRFDEAQDSDLEINILDQLGRVIYNDVVNGTQHDLSLEGMSKGIYFVRVTSATSESVQKMVIQ